MTAMMGHLVQAQQAPSGFFTDPVLVLGGGGHQAPVKSMVFSTSTGSQLLTGGMDKVIHVWNLDADRSGPARTLRPPNWRGFRGQIDAMALSPRDDGGNQRLLAVAGYGVLGDIGEILLFRYPGPTAQGTGDIEGQLPATAADGTIGPGHAGVVNSLAFTPDGRFLASASNDKTIRIWEIATRTQVAVLSESSAEVNALAIFANGTRLVAGGNDGFLRLYDITNRARPVFIARANPILPNGAGPGVNPLTTFSRAILTLAAGPDNLRIVVGTEGGGLFRYSAANLGGVVEMPASPPGRLTGPVEAVAISPDGRLLATSEIASSLAVPTALPTTTCVIEVRAMPGGQVLQRVATLSNLVRALAFSPDSRRLAYSGGDAQSLFVKDLAPNSETDEIKGYGTSFWDVGFRADSKAIRFARTHPVAPGQGAEFEYFDLRGRFFYNPEANEPAYRHAVAAESGRLITPVDQYQFNFQNARGRVWPRSLDPINERRWWAYTLIPPGPGHLEPVAAVAADAGVVLWNLATGEKTRFFNGHAGSVYSLASSPDGKWLVTGSSDQTVRLWSLDGCDRPPAFGAKFARQAAGWVVIGVTPEGFADRIGLKVGHVVEKFSISDYGPAFEVDPAPYLPRLDQDSPTRMFSFDVRMPGEAAPLRVATTKRDSPALSLFPGIDRRWVLWTPKGFYDSSADGDRKFLGWLTNRGTIAQLLAGTYDSIDKFAVKYRQPKAPARNEIDRLLDPADPNQAVVAAPAVPADVPDPTNSRLAVLSLKPAVAAPIDGPVPVAQPTVRLNYRALAEAGAAGISRLWIEVNGRKLPDIVNGPAVRDAQGFQDVPIGNDRTVKARLVSIDQRGVPRSEAFDIRNETIPPPAARKSRLEIVAIGSDEFADKRLSRIPYAEEDARDLTKFLREKLVDPATGLPFGADQVHERQFLGGRVAKADLLANLDALQKAVPPDKLVEGDVVVVVVESHFIEFRSQRLLATSEADDGGPGPPSLSASLLADRLGEITQRGCRAIVLVDAVHEIKTPAWVNDIQEWVRQLQTQANAVVFIASDHGPSLSIGDGHRVFAEAILNVAKAKSAGRLRKPGGPLSLFDFQRTVTDTVLQRTGRKQHAQCYLPETVSIQDSILAP